jgi:hypothetical protein
MTSAERHEDGGFARAFDEALRGDFVRAEDLFARDALAGAESLALRALFETAAPGLVHVPRPEDVETFASAASARDRTLVLEACEHMCLSRWLALDARGVARWAGEAAKIGASEHARALEALSRADAALAREHVDALGKKAAREGRAARVVDAASLAALAGLLGGDVADAVQRSRRASRMARTESLLQQEYLANLVLARARRYEGRPHLGARILSQLALVLPSPWRAHLEWELALAGSTARFESAHAQALDRVSLAAKSGERRAFEDAAAELTASVAEFPPFAREAAVVLALFDRARECPPEASRWVRGDDDAVPPIGYVDPRESAGSIGVVLTGPTEEPRRILRGGVALDPTPRHAPTDDGKEHRALTLLCALGLASPAGLAIEIAFERVYGFAFTDEKHDGVLRTLLHRTRALLGDAGEIARRDDRLFLIPKTALAIPDPRCRRPIEQRILARLAESGGDLGAKEIATELRVPLRTVQLALEGLVDAGACVAEKRGRRVEYIVEDSVFCQPSFSRLARTPGRSREASR